MAPQTDYSKDGLLKQARVWDGQATLVAGFHKTSSDLVVNTEGGGAFEECIKLYHQCQQEIVGWTGQGTTAIQDITGALADAARKYGATEDEISGAIKNIGGRGN